MPATVTVKQGPEPLVIVPMDTEPPAPAVVQTPVIEEEPVAAEPAKPAPPAKLIVKRRHDTTEEDLRRQIEKAPELALDRTPARHESTALVQLARGRRGPFQVRDPAPELMKERTDLAGLPMRMGDACKIGPATADHLQAGALALRAALFDATNRGAAAADPRPDPTKVQTTLSNATGRFNSGSSQKRSPHCSSS